MQFFRYLNLPNNPLKDVQSVIERNTNKEYIAIDPYGFEDKDVLTEEIINAISSLGLDISYVVVFKTYNRPFGNIEKRVIHTDLVWKENKWIKMPFGINWEIGDDSNDSIFQWWDMSAHSEHYPSSGHENLNNFSKLSGLHYSQRFNLGAPEGSILLEETKLDRATLVRTDVPHSVIYTGSKRMSVSIRFKQNISWNEAVEIFKPLILEN